MSTASQEQLAHLWSPMGGEAAALGNTDLPGQEPVLPGIYNVGVQAQAAISFRSEGYLRVDDVKIRTGFDPIHGFYKCGDGSWVQIHGNFPQHRMAAAELLRCTYSRPGVQRVLDGMAAAEVEELFAANMLPCARMRSEEEWGDHPQSAALDAQPIVMLEKIGEADPRPLPPAGKRPLDGLKVLDLTKVIAGPVCGRTMTEHGAQVLQITAAHMAHAMALVIDSNRGKRSAYLDLRKEPNVEHLKALAKDADIFVQGYRPGTLAKRGLSPEAMAELRPGIVYVSLSAFGHEGPWAHRRGFDSVVQTASGIGQAGGVAAGMDGMHHLPCQSLDHASGCLMAFGGMMARLKQSQEGGSWLVRVSLARTGRWLQSLGKQDALDVFDPQLEDVQDMIEDYGQTPHGRMRGVKPAAILSATPGYWASPSVPPGYHTAE